MNPVQAFNATFNAASASVQSLFVTFSFAITQEFEAFVQIDVITPATYSAGAEVYSHRSVDGGATWVSDGTFKGAFPATVSSTHSKTINLETGQYLVAVMVGNTAAADVTCSVNFSTAYVITAYE